MTWLTADSIAYDPDTGVFFWTRHRSTNARLGDICGTVGAYGYWKVYFKKRLMSGHKLAWFLFYGEWPSMNIDHKNGTRTDNRICNLRLATGSQNIANSRSKSTGSKGTCFHKGANKWMAQITVRRKTIYLGLFDSQKEAHEAYMIAAVEHFGEFARAS